jgi:glycosyltransferase involved in cell wall biosynthesis
MVCWNAAWVYLLQRIQPMTMQLPTPADDPARLAPPTAGTSARISVALCTYNGARFLVPQLDSFLAQTRLPDELVACDDGSTDETLAILERFKGHAPFPVRLFRNDTRLGSTKNFEKAIGLCTGDLIATSDQDDVWLPEKLALSESALAGDPGRGLVFTDADVVDDDLRSRGHRMWDTVHFGRLAQRRVRKGEAFEVLLRQWVVTGATMMFRSEYRPYILPIPADWIHDGWIAFIIGAMATMGSVECSTVKYRQHSAQQIGGKKLSWKERHELAREMGPPHFRLAYARFAAARDRLQSFAARVRDERFLSMVERKVQHQRRRLAISESPSRWRRVLWALGEFSRGGYQRYSAPAGPHFFKDLFL